MASGGINVVTIREVNITQTEPEGSCNLRSGRDGPSHANIEPNRNPIVFGQTRNSLIAIDWHCHWSAPGHGERTIFCQYMNSKNRSKHPEIV